MAIRHCLNFFKELVVGTLRVVRNMLQLGLEHSTKNRYVVFGSGGLAKELIAYIEADGTDEVVCVVSSGTFNNAAYSRRYAVVEAIQAGAYPGAKFLLAVADPDVKKVIVGKNENRWATYIHPSCVISPYAVIGAGCVIAPQCIVSADATLDRFVFMGTHAFVGHDSHIGSWTTMYPSTKVCGGCQIGVSCVFGVGSYVLPGKHIADTVKVSAGSVVRHSFDGSEHIGVTLQGNPAQQRV